MDKSLNKVIKKHIVLTALTGVAIVLMMITITYGLYQNNHENTIDQEISLGDFDVDLTSSSGQITLSNLNPGVENSATYTFTTSNSGDYVVKYNVYFTDNTSVFLADGTNAENYSSYSQITSQNYQYIEYKLDNGEYRSLSEVYDSTAGKFIILNGRLQQNISHNHSVKFKVSPNAPNDIQGSILALNITMEASATEEAGVDTIMNLVAGEPINTTDVITKDAPSGATCTNTLAYDGTADNNLRYIGANPCNYVTFNNEVAGWRIIGVMNNIDDGTGKKETRLKLLRADILNVGSFDSSDSTINSGYGINDWTQADLMQELNGDYLDTTLNANTYWYNGRNNAKTRAYDYTKGLKQEAQNLIDNAKWYLGGVNDDQIYSSNGIKPSEYYKQERKNIVWGGLQTQTCDDGYCPRKTSWTGKIALIYPSDYGFAVGGSVRSTCLAKSMYAFKTDNCSTNNWIPIVPSTNQWTLTPYSDDAIRVLAMYSNGEVSTGKISDNSCIKPALYLKSSVKIISGTGSETDPYVLK